MKIRSKQLWQYLNERGLLNGLEGDIKQAKAEYVRKYKREWKLRNRKPQKEIRVMLSIRDYIDFKIKADDVKLSPTKLLKELALVAAATKQIVPDQDCLRKVLQLIAMAVTSKTYSHLIEAECLLLEYVKKYCQ